MSLCKTAPVDMFTTLRPRPLAGRELSEIKAVQASVARFGLLSPIVVTRNNGKLTIVDGRKRLAAIRRLDFMGRLPRSLVNIPYIEVAELKGSADQTPALMSNRDLYNTVIGMFRQNQDVDAIAADLYLCHKSVRQVLTLSRLSPRLRQAFFNRTIDFSRAKSYAAIAGHLAQEDAFMALGPFAGEQEILDYIHNPEPQVDIPMRMAA